VFFFKQGVSTNLGAGSPGASSSSACQICNSKDHFATICPQIGDLKPKCGKCGLPHKMENCGIRCGYCSGMDHTEDRCWKNGKDRKALSATNNYLEVLVDDEEAALEQLIRLCGTKHHIFSRARIPQRRLPVEMNTLDAEIGGDLKQLGKGMQKQTLAEMLHQDRRSLQNFIKGKMALSPMETILSIPGELEYRESLVKLAWKKQDEGLKLANVLKAEGAPAIHKICINKNNSS